jgi:hypothetical protein
VSSSDVLDLIQYALFIIPGIIGLLVAFRAWSLRRVLVDPVYRSRALWTGFAGLGVLAFILAVGGDELVTEGYGIFANQNVGLIAEDIWWAFVFLGLYGWIYTNVNVSLSSDFLHRDVLLWNRIGKNLTWVSIVVAYSLASLPEVPQDASWYNAASNAVGGVFAIVTIYTAFVLAITYRRIPDRLIKRYTMWVVLAVVSLFVALFLGNGGGFLLFLGILPAYFMYRAAGSLSLRTRDIDQK